MRIVVDLQGAQAASTRNRGIGRYSLGFAEAIVRNCGPHDVHLALNGAFPESIDSIRSRCGGLIPGDRIHVFDVLDPLSDTDWADDPRRKASEICREAFIAKLNPDIVHVTSLVEGMREDAVSSIGRLALNIPTAVTLYDLIPLAHPEEYLRGAGVERWYAGRIEQLERADLLLAISKASADEAIERLTVDPARVVEVGAGADPSFRPVTLAERERLQLLSRHGISRPFIMYTGGIDPRKNVAGLVEAFARLPAGVRDTHQLVIACECSGRYRKQLVELCRRSGLADDALVVTGFVEDHDLAALYSLTRLFVFPSLHEGFGLPVLEAMQCGAPVLGSNCSSIPEVVGLEDALFDPRAPEAISEALLAALTDEDQLARLRKNSAKQAAKFSWDEVARRALAAFEQLHQREQGRAGPEVVPGPKPRLAYVSPVPPARSGIAAYGEQIVPHLASHYDIDIIVDPERDGETRLLPGASRLVTATDFAATSYDYDRILYHFGNSEYHDYMLPLVEAVPGVVLLHDFSLGGLVRHHAFSGATPEEGELNWLAALHRNHGAAAVAEFIEAGDAETLVSAYPCNSTVVGRSVGALVHSDHARRLADRWFAPERASRFTSIPLPCPIPDDVDHDGARARLGLTEQSRMICSFGLIGPSKRSLELLQAWMRSAAFEDPGYRLVFVGARGAGDHADRLADEIHRHGLESRVEVTGWVDDSRYRDYLAACDLAVQLRTDSRGESSLAALECLSFGVPTIANANGSMAELPKKAVRLLPDRFATEELSDAIDSLYRGGRSARAMAKAGREFVSAERSPADCARRLFVEVERFYNREADPVPALAAHSSQFSRGDAERLARIAAESTNVASARTIALDVSQLSQATAGDQTNQLRPLFEQFASGTPSDWRLKLVRYDEDRGVHVEAHDSLASLLSLDSPILPSWPVDLSAGDIVVLARAPIDAVVSRAETFEQLRRRGVRLSLFVDEIRDPGLGRLSPEQARKTFDRWLAVVAGADRVLCSSLSLADELGACLDAAGHAAVNVEVSTPESIVERIGFPAGL